MEKKYKLELDGQEVRQADYNGLATVAAQSADRLLGDILHVGSASANSKLIIPRASLQASNYGDIVRPSGADGSVRIYNHKAVVLRAQVSDPNSTFRGANSGDYIGTAYPGTDLYGTQTFTANSSGSARWDLVYVTVATDVNSASETRYIKDTVSPFANTPTSVHTHETTTVTVGVVTGTAAAHPTLPTIPADATSSYKIPLAYVRIPNGFGASSTVLTTDIYTVAPIGEVNALGGISARPGGATNSISGAMMTATAGSGYTPIQDWGSSGTRPTGFMPSTMAGGASRFFCIDCFDASTANHTFRNNDVIDSTIDWGRRLFKFTVGFDNGSFGMLGFSATWTADANVLVGLGNSMIPGDASAIAMSTYNGVGAYASLTDLVTGGFRFTVNSGGNLVFTRVNPSTLGTLFVWLEASGQFGNY